MRSNLPPLKTLHAFEAAGRRGSFKAAAEELNVTPSAISHRISALESFVGERLFEPQGRGLVLTNAGRNYLISVRETFSQLSAATDQIRNRGMRGPLTIRTYPTFAERWLIPRLRDFCQKYPDIEIHLISTQDTVDFSSLETDVAIAYGEQDWPEYECAHLFNEEIVPVCSPQHLALMPNLNGPEDLLGMTLIHIFLRPDEWRWWFSGVGIKGNQKGLSHHVSTRDFALEAAAAGLGFTLGHSPFIHSEIKNGRLVAPFDMFQSTRNAYSLVTTKARAKLPRVVVFREWILTEVVRDHRTKSKAQ